jgi:hypothetical protein
MNWSLIGPIAIIAIVIVFTGLSAFSGSFDLRGYGKVTRANDPLLFWFCVVAPLVIGPLIVFGIYRASL